MSTRKLVCTGMICALALGMPAAAQEAPSAAQDKNYAYPPEFFANSQPTTAYDMVALVPGFRLIEGDATVRGYSGAAGNILIDGQRPAGKAETLEEILKRIPAPQVARVELVHAGASGVDMQGYPLLANVVLAHGGTVSGRIEGEAGVFKHGDLAPRLAGQLTLNRGKKILNLSAAAFRTYSDVHGFGTRHRYDQDGTVQRLADYFQPELTKTYEGTADFQAPLAGGSIHLNGLARDAREIVDLGYDVFYPAADTIRGSERLHARTYQGGLRYERPLGPSTDLDLVSSYQRVTKVTSEDERTATTFDRQEGQSKSSEAILRGALRHHSGPWSFEAGAEGAINTLDTTNRLYEDGVPVPLPNPHVRVEEHRAEFFANANRDLSSRVSLETGLRYEISRLAQSGDTQLVKSLAFLKPRARLNWSPVAGHQLRLTVEREVGQLDFSNFVASAAVGAGTVSAGNRDLEPDTLWRVELGYEHRFGAGSLVLAARREWISNLVDKLPVVVNNTVYDAVGNIGDAHRDEIEGSVKLPLDRLGLPNVLFSADATWRRGRVVDPSTLLRRPISEDTPFELSARLTHDIPAWHLRWGISYVHANQFERFNVRELQINRTEGRLDLFVEYKPGAHWALRAFADNVTDSPTLFTRDVYYGLREISAFRYHDLRTLRSGPHFGLNVQYSFGQ